MKRKLFAGFALMVLLALVFLPVRVLAANPTPITITKITISPPDPYPGQKVEITFDYKYPDPGGATVEADYEVSLSPITKEAQAGTPIPAQPPAAAPASVTSSVASGKVAFETTGGDAQKQATLSFFAPTEDGEYNVTITLTAVKGVLVDETGIGSKSEPKPETERFSFPAAINVYTALPAGLSQLFAGLGLFAAVMAVMAVGTEVVVEMLKSMVGLKSKVTAMDAFNELKTELPGLLAGAGVDEKAREKVLAMVDQAQSTIKPVEDAASAVAKLKKGELFEAYEALIKLKAGIKAPDVQTLKETAKSKVSEALSVSLEKLGLDPSLTANIEQAALNLIDSAKTAEDMDALIKGFFTGFQNALNNIIQNKDEIERWILGQLDKYLTQGEAGLQTFVDATIQTLSGLGFPVADVKNWLAQALDAVEHSARDKSEVFAHSVRNLLTAVEARRNEIQSPARLLWRRLRDSYLPLWFFDVILIGVPLGVIFGFAKVNLLSWLAPLVPLDFSLPAVVWGAGILSGLLVGVALWLLSLLLSAAGEEAKLMRNRQAGPPQGTIGHFLRFTVERLYNRFMGRGSNVVDPSLYGNVDNEVTRKIGTVGPTTVASTLLTQENQHQDEETRRVRLIRVLSAVIGTILAYYMKIDAAVYLGYAVPDVVAQINGVNLHAIWPLIPQDFTVGILLTGLASSAGSKFWRDLLGKLQSARGQAEEAARMVERVKSALPSPGETSK